MQNVALLYNDKSVLENYHCAEGYKIIDKHGLFGKNTVDQRKKFRRLIIMLVLITDLSDHFRFTSELKNVLSLQFGRLDGSKKDLLLKMVIKISDIGHGSKLLSLHQKWSLRVSEEFYRQGDQGIHFPID